MTVESNEQIVLVARPNGVPSPSDFAMRRCDIPRPGPGEVLLRNRTLALSPGDRLYMHRHPLGQVLRGHTIAEVIEGDDLTPTGSGDVVFARGGWQRLSVADVGSVRPLQSLAPHPLSAFLHVLGATGLTAFHGLTSVARVAKGETIIITAASGSVGSIAAQLARSRGCRVILVTGPDPSKIDWLRHELGFVELVSEEHVRDELRALAPDGADVVFDSVGGAVLDGILRYIGSTGRQNVRVVLCGMVSQYNRGEATPAHGLHNLHVLINSRSEMRGFVVGDYRGDDDAARQALLDMMMAGKLQYREDWTVGLHGAPHAFIRMMTRDTFGKCLVNVDAKAAAP